MDMGIWQAIFTTLPWHIMLVSLYVLHAETQLFYEQASHKKNQNSLFYDTGQHIWYAPDSTSSLSTDFVRIRALDKSQQLFMDEVTGWPVIFGQSEISFIKKIANQKSAGAPFKPKPASSATTYDTTRQKQNNSMLPKRTTSATAKAWAPLTQFTGVTQQ